MAQLYTLLVRADLTAGTTSRASERATKRVPLPQAAKKAAKKAASPRGRGEEPMCMARHLYGRT